MTPSDGFDVFLSHNSKDKLTVLSLAAALRARGLRVWLDQDQIVPGQSRQEALEQIIGNVKSAAVLVGNDGLGPWEQREMRAILTEFVARKLPVIPVLLPGAPREPNLPLFLREFAWVDFRRGLRHESLDRLVWGITGVRPDSATGSDGDVPLPVQTSEPTAVPENAETRDCSRHDKLMFTIVSGDRNQLRNLVRAMLGIVQLSPLIPLDCLLRDELANLDLDPSSRRDLIDDAAHLLAESGSKEMCLPAGYVNRFMAPRPFAGELLREAGKVGAPALAALCAAMILTWETTTEARRVFAELCATYGQQIQEDSSR